MYIKKQYNTYLQEVFVFITKQHSLCGTKDVIIVPTLQIYTWKT